jgi:hypothetical protein
MIRTAGDHACANHRAGCAISDPWQKWSHWEAIAATAAIDSQGERDRTPSNAQRAATPSCLVSVGLFVGLSSVARWEVGMGSGKWSGRRLDAVGTALTPSPCSFSPLCSTSSSSPPCSLPHVAAGAIVASVAASMPTPGAARHAARVVCGIPCAAWGRRRGHIHGLQGASRGSKGSTAAAVPR